ncbi:MAG: aminotransferase class I/II-fold pyridoxal phosphate-dependent enzyme [Rubrivivax sp.]|nr:aminotransferase class I/II-fold pyridoxal phosphate-dependent enzyme [Rubrivivax sp.]
MDEIYLDLAYATGRRSAAAGSDVLVAGSFSKFFHIAGAWAGWCRTRRRWWTPSRNWRRTFFICPVALAQHAALAWSRGHGPVPPKRRDEFQARRDHRAELRELGFSSPGRAHAPSMPTWTAAPSPPDSSAFASQMLEEAGVALVPGEDFGGHQPQRAGCGCRMPPRWRTCTRRCSGCVPGCRRARRPGLSGLSARSGRQQRAPPAPRATSPGAGPQRSCRARR